MKLSAIVNDPSLKNQGIGKYRYKIKFKGDRKAVEVDSHMSAVFTIVSGLLQKEMMTEQQLNEIRACASYHLTVEVTNLSDSEIKSMLLKAGWKNRYSLKHRIIVGDQTLIVCREWVAKRVDKLIDAITPFCKVERIESPVSRTPEKVVTEK